MAVETMPRQLTFDVGGATPDAATLNVTGQLELDAMLRKGDRLTLRLVNDDGELLAEGSGQVVQVAFKDKLAADGVVERTVRAHTVRLG